MHAALTHYDRRPSGREAFERAAEIALAQPLECAVAKLAHTLARDAEHVADLFQRVLTSTIQAEVETHDLRVTRLQRLERLLDVLAQQPLLDLLLRLVRFVMHETLDELAVVAVTDRGVQPDLRRVQRLQGRHDFRCQRSRGRYFLDRRIATQLLLQSLPLTEDALKIARPVQRNAHCAPLVRQCSKDRLTDPPHRVRDELHALVRIELARRRHQTDVALLDQVDQRDTAILVLLGHTDHEPQVRADQRLHGLLIAGLRPMTQLDLLLRRQELVPADLAQILIECRALLTGACKPFHLYIRASATPTRLGHTSHSDRSPSEFDSTARAADSPYPTARSLPPRPLACLSGMPRRAYLKPRALTSSSACAGAGKLRSPSPPSRARRVGIGTPAGNKLAEPARPATAGRRTPRPRVRAPARPGPAR